MMGRIWVEFVYLNNKFCAQRTEIYRTDDTDDVDYIKNDSAKISEIRVTTCVLFLVLNLSYPG